MKEKELSRPLLDQKLYRYRPLRNNCIQDIDNIINEINTANIYLSNPFMFNDPFETQYISSDMYNEKFVLKKLINTIEKYYGYSYLYDYIYNKSSKFTDKNNCIILKDFVELSYDAVKKYTKKNRKEDLTKNKYIKLLIDNTSQAEISKINNISIACFSESWNSIPMWAYYSSDFKGVCLEYDFSKIRGINNKIISNMYKVSYSSIMPKNKYRKMYSPTIKGTAWSHEQEWRFIISNTDENVEHINNCYFYKMPYLSSIIVGSNISNDNLTKIMMAKIRNKNLNHVNIYQVNPNNKEYKLDKTLVMGTFSK